MTKISEGLTWTRGECWTTITMITALAIILLSWIAVSLVFCLALCFTESRPMPEFEPSAENPTIMVKRLPADESRLAAARVYRIYVYSRNVFAFNDYFEVLGSWIFRVAQDSPV